MLMQGQQDDWTVEELLLYHGGGSTAVTRHYLLCFQAVLTSFSLLFLMLATENMNKYL